MTVSRRRFMEIALVGGGAALAGRYGLYGLHSASARQRFNNPLKIPPLDTGKRQGGRTHYNLAVQAGKSEFFEGISTPTIGVNSPYLGPTIRCRAGDRITLNVTNKLAVDTTVHWHGLHLPARADGGPHQIVKPGATWSPSFVVKQKAAMFWYHSHLLHETGAQVNQGLAGLILVDDDESDALNLPKDYGVDDIPLVVQDRRFGRDGSFIYLASMHDRMMGFKGDTILVNGTVQPYLTVKRTRTRLRILNGSNSRIYNFGFDDGRAFLQIASDGSLLERPVRRQRLRLAPAERTEILVDMAANSRTILMSYPDVPASGGMMGRMMAGMVGNNETFPVIELRAGHLERSDNTMPQRLVAVPGWGAREAQRTRRFELNMGMMGMMGGRGMMRGRGMMMGGGGPPMGINGKSMQIDRIDERVPLGATEIWSIRNPTPVSHPFHIHDIQFRILDRNGRAPRPHELGLKDTVLIDSGETVQIITKFADYADPDLPYMYHCHILEHEDNGMMGQFVVTG